MKRLKLFFVICFIGILTRAYAGIEPAVSTYLEGKYFINYAPVNNDFVIGGAAFNNFLSGFAFTSGQFGFPTGQQVRKIDNTLHLYMDPQALEYLDFSYELTVTIQITAYENGSANPNPTPVNEILKINYNPGERTTFNEKASLHFANAGKVIYRVVSATFTSALTDAQKIKVSKTVNLSSEIIVERYKTFDETQIPALNSIFHYYNNMSNELVIWWGNIAGTELFELEWAYVDNYGANGIERMATDLKFNKDYNLSKNSTRVQISTNSYVIPMVYERGYIIFRVRFIGKKYVTTPDKIYTIPGQWSDASFGSGPNLNTFVHKYKIVNPHEGDKKNWQITTTYAEEGKRKDVVAYMDGTQRNRQTITGLSTEQATLVGESIYDHQGRASIQVLPVPVPLDPYYTSNNRALKYYNNFNRNNAGNSYNRTHFDITQSACGAVTEPMSTASGASNYYSGSNPDKTNENAYIPDAKSYPFTQTEYTPDNTGRIKKQSGVGFDHKLGSTHETDYYYGTPMQEELFMLFGNEVGEASHYKKNVVKDPNGQLSVSILNLSGNVIASALAGNPPKNLDSLASYQPYQMDVDLLTFNSKDIVNQELLSHQSITVTTQSDYVLHYTVSNSAFQTALCNGIQLCLDCVYDLEFKVIDNYSCDHVVYHHSQVVGPFTYNTDSSIHVNDQCPKTAVSFNTANLPDPFTINLPVGTYTIIKSLKVNKAATSAYVEHYIERFNVDCHNVYDDILNEQLALIDSAACNIEDTGVTENKCDIARMAMLSDLNPGGQYGLIDWASNTANDPTSVFNTSNILPQPNANWRNPVPANVGYLDENGVRIQVLDPVTNTQKYPEQLTQLSDFLDIWQESFAEALLPYHPEYCYLDWCNRINSTSFDYDVRITLTPKYNDAITNGYFTPMTADPYFAGSAIHFVSIYNINTKMAQELSNFHNSGFSMLQLAVMTAFESNNIPYTTTIINNWIANPGLNPAIADLVWETYRAFYLSKKEELQYADRVEYAMKVCSKTSSLGGCSNKGGYNECIGVDPNPFDWSRNNFGSGTGGFGGFFNSPFFIGGQACSAGSYNYYSGKGIRFPGFQSVFTPIDPYASNLNASMQQASDYLNNNSPCAKGNVSGKEICPPTPYAGNIINLMNLLLARRKFTANDTVNSLLSGALKPDFLIGGKVNWEANFNRKIFTGTLSSGKKKCSFTIELPAGITPDNFGFITSIIPNNTTIDPTTGYTYSAIISIRLNNSDKVITTKMSNTCYPFSYCKRCPPVVATSVPVLQGNPDKTVINNSKKNNASKQAFNAVIRPEPTNLSTAFPPGGETVRRNSSIYEATNHALGFPPRPDPRNGNRICDTCKGITFTYDINGKPFIRPAARNACDPCHPTLDSVITDTIVNECIEQQVQAAYINAQNSYQQILDSIRINIRSLYIEHCLQASETFTAGYMDAMHHFTLYYYNQAGNLIKTIPPVGVVKLNNSQIMDAKNYQAGTNSVPIYNNHGVKSQYWYNSLDQLREQTQPDHDGKSVFFYDYLGRMVASQNPEQKTSNKYSYTWYDAIGRIEEVGELNSVPFILTDPQARNPVQFSNWVNGSTKKQITRTRFDEAYPSVVSNYFGGDASNYRGRVASSMYFETNVPTYTNATHFKYDIHGNVKKLAQDLVKLPVKLIEYEYDLISGKVNRLKYQPGKVDQFIHKYTYDADNRLSTVQTSRDGFVWDHDAVYRYYKHEPLSRVILGQNKVQTEDFVYTIQGWIKGVNSPTLDVKTDPGHDGGLGTHSLIARDATGFILRYFTDDYKPIGNAIMYEPTYIGTNYQRLNRDLYNGNIQSMITGIASPKNSGVAMGTLATAYSYDQLNRIKEMHAYTGPNIGSINNSFINSNVIADFACAYTYDANGNILTLDRNGNTQSGSQLQMDILDYYYNQGTNQLSKVKEQVPAGNYPNDIDGIKSGYSYDKIGNLIQDNEENLTLDWNVYEKIKTIKKGTSITNYTYNSTGARIIKEYYNSQNNKTTYTFYIKDASGNTLATYQANTKTYNMTDIQFQSVFIYGSSRLGEERIDSTMAQLETLRNIHTTRWNSSRSRGLKYYELSNHLGNILATISDRKLPDNPGANNPIQFYKADLWTANDYYPFGSVIPGRNYSNDNYRYGFNGKENDNDVKGDGNQQDYGMRIYDPRLGKFLSVDPLFKTYAWNSTYCFAENSPIKYIDLDGKEKNDPSGCPKWNLKNTSSKPTNLQIKPIRLPIRVVIVEEIKSPDPIPEKTGGKVSQDYVGQFDIPDANGANFEFIPYGIGDAIKIYNAATGQIIATSFTGVPNGEINTTTNYPIPKGVATIRVEIFANKASLNGGDNPDSKYDFNLSGSTQEKIVTKDYFFLGINIKHQVKSTTVYNKDAGIKVVLDKVMKKSIKEIKNIL